MLNSRELGWNVVTGIGYSFILTIIMAIIALLVKLFYPPSGFYLSPILALIYSPAVGIVQLILLGAIIAFSAPIRTRTAREELRSVRKLAIYVGIGYLVFSLLPYAFHVPYIQTYIGLVIAFNVLNGGIGGLASSIS